MRRDGLDPVSAPPRPREVGQRRHDLGSRAQEEVVHPKLDPVPLPAERDHGVPVVVDHEAHRLPEPGRDLVGEPLGGRDAIRPRRVPGVEGEVELAGRRLHGPSPSPSPWTSRSTRSGSMRSAIPFSWLKVTAPGAAPFTFFTCLARV